MNSILQNFQMLKNKLLRSTAGLLVLLTILAVPSFWSMLRPGIFSMHDFHIFRMFEFDRCIQDLQIPCRWAPDSGFEYGQPLFNFYGQAVYIPAELFHLLGFQIIDSIKIMFVLSLLGSAFAMFFLGRQVWGSRTAGLLSALLYVYAPYRAVDVFVRGALPEAFAFVLFPIIIFFFNRYVLAEKRKDLLFFILSFSILVLTHNLSVLIFSEFLLVWGVYFVTLHRKWFLVKNFIWASLLIVGLSSFYLLPVFFEGSLVTLGKTLEGYYNFRAHFTTLNELLITRFWGYGASLWGPVDDLSLSIGHLQWILSLVALVLFFVFRKARRNLHILVIVLSGWFALFLTHDRSAFIWELVSPLAFLQFPWRFLSIATFALALSGGAVILVFRTSLRVIFLSVLLSVLILINFQFFKEDRWFNITDREQFSGELWKWQTSSALNDFWPKYAKGLPTNTVPNNPEFLAGHGKIISFNKTSKSMTANIVVDSQNAVVQFPSVYFDGWKGFVNGKPVQIAPRGDYGQITMKLENGEQIIALQFTNTPVRTLGNVISLITLGIFGFLLLKRK